ncbi:MAG: Crp/Fnr family transcriptional regulator [Candidatus Hydrothermae bacterium]|nr:Crp/Fnr family transcriptional regulator [Candidatus Hydrothermae bacterium]
MTDEAKLEVVQQIPLFSKLREESIQFLLPYIVVREIAAGTTVIREEEAGEFLFVVLKGRFKVTKNSPEGKEVLLSYLGEGSIFGERALLGRRRSANVTAVEDARVLLLDRRDFLHVLRRNPEVALELLDTLMERLENTNRHLASLAFWDVAGRVAHALEELAEEIGETHGEGVLIPRSRLRVQDLASYVGATREAVSRALRVLSDQGAVVSLSEGFLLPGKGS